MRIGTEVEIVRGQFRGQTGTVTAYFGHGACADFRVRHTLPPLHQADGIKHRTKTIGSWFSARSLKPRSTHDPS